MCDNENYYLVGYDAADEKIKHYRVDKMKQLYIVDERRLGQESFKAFEAPSYSKSLFGMFSGEEKAVTLEAENGMVGILIDRFGKDISITPADENHFRTVVNVSVSDQFLGWIVALGSGIRIVGPEDVVGRMREIAGHLISQYGTD